MRIGMQNINFLEVRLIFWLIFEKCFKFCHQELATELRTRGPRIEATNLTRFGCCSSPAKLCFAVRSLSSL